MTHYVYKITDSKTREFYIGCRSFDGDISEDSYMGSYTSWEPEDTSRLRKKVIKDDFETREDAIGYEAKLIQEHINDELNRNYHIPNKGFHVKGLPKTKEWTESVSKALSGENNPMYGKTHTKDAIEKIKKARKKQVLTEEQLELLRTMNCGKKFTEEHKNKISKSRKEFYENNEVWNKGLQMPSEVGRKISEAKTGTQLSEEHKKKLSEIAKNRTNIKCPHCDKSGHKPLMIRWHFDNCKYKDNE